MCFIDFKKAYDTVNRDQLLQTLKHLGINGLFLKNIASMYEKTKYAIKLNKGHLDAIDSNLGLKQGCPLSPILFNLYIDDINKIFQEQCDPIDFQGVKINHFLYADDLVLLSSTDEGLQSCLNNLHDFSASKDLTINIKKSKTMIFNTTGKLFKKYFTLNGKTLEPVQSFCYLGFDIKASGTVSLAINTLYDKASKAIRPLMCVIARFNIPVKTSLKLFHTFISPIMLYNVENWATLSEKKIQKFTSDSIFTDIEETKADILHRKFIKYVLGASKSCPNIAVYGETGETPLSLKGFKLMLNYWYRIKSLPNDTLVKKALHENINLRTNWIITIEKLVNCLNLTDTIENPGRFKRMVKSSIQSKFIESWGKKLKDENLSRLKFYGSIKNDFTLEKYLELPCFNHRKLITKIRCSDHQLEIEKGRHRKLPREERICRLCTDNEIETEDHFLVKCKFYDHLKIKHDLSRANIISNMINNKYLENFGQYLNDALAERTKYLESKLNT